MRYGDIRANDTDYDGIVVVEMFYGDRWAVPAWEEKGEPDFAGPFDSICAAQKIVSESCWNDAA